MLIPQAANFRALLAQRRGRGAILQACIEGVPDVLCTQAPALGDRAEKTYAVNLDTVDDLIDFGTATQLAQLTDWTICTWIKREGTLIDIGAYNVSTNGFRLRITGAGVVQAWWSGSTVDLTGATVADGEWTFVAISVGGNSQTVSRGILGTATSTTILTTKTSAVSRATRNAFTGGTAFQLISGFTNAVRVGYAAVFNRALSIKEMQRIKFRMLRASWGTSNSLGLFASSSPGLWNDLVAQWEFERGTGTLVTNTKNPGTHDGTLTNGPTWVSDACFALTYREVLGADASSAQEIEPLGTRTSSQSTTLTALDLDGWLTARLSTLDGALAGRDVRVWLGFVGLAESEYQMVAGGPLTSVAFADRAYRFTFGDALSEAGKRISLARSTLSQAMTNANDASVPTSTYFHNNGSSNAYAKVDDEIFAWTAIAADTAARYTLDCSGARGQLGTTAAAHDSAAVIEEIIRISVASSVYVILRYLLTAFGYEAGDDYDLLSETAYTDASTLDRRGRGLGMSPADVDSLAMLAVPGLISTPMLAYFDESIDDAKDFLEREILRPFGAFFTVRADARVSVLDHTIPDDDDVVYDLGPDQIRDVAVDLGDESTIVNWIEAEYDYSPATGAFAGQFTQIDAASRALFGTRKRTYKFKGLASTTTPTGATLLGTWATAIIARFAQPLLTIDVVCGLSEFVLEVGDAVRLSHPEVPNVAAGVVGAWDLRCQVIARRVDLRAGTVGLRLVDVSRMS